MIGKIYFRTAIWFNKWNNAQITENTDKIGVKTQIRIFITLTPGLQRSKRTHSGHEQSEKDHFRRKLDRKCISALSGLCGLGD